MMKWLFYLVLFPFSLFASCGISKLTEKIPPYEQKDLEAFFRHIFIQESCGFSLFGEKPMSMGGFWELNDLNFSHEILDPIGFILETCGLKNTKVQRGWKVWNKYQNLFPEKNFLIFDSKLHFSNNYRLIVFINKRVFSETFEKHKDDFKYVLGDDITSETLIEMFKNEKMNFYSVLKDHDGLLGILLGYGRENAFLFHRRNEIDNKFWTPHLFSLNRGVKKPSKGFSHLSHEVFYLRKSLNFFPKNGQFIPSINELGLHLPGFVVNFNLKETSKIEAQFEKEWRKIIHQYRNKDFLEVTLAQLLFGS